MRLPIAWLYGVAATPLPTLTPPELGMRVPKLSLQTPGLVVL